MIFSYQFHLVISVSCRFPDDLDTAYPCSPADEALRLRVYCICLVPSSILLPFDDPKGELSTSALLDVGTPSGFAYASDKDGPCLLVRLRLAIRRARFSCPTFLGRSGGSSFSADSFGTTLFFMRCMNPTFLPCIGCSRNGEHDNVSGVMIFSPERARPEPST